MNGSMKHEKFIKIPTSSNEIKTAMFQMYVGMLCREQNRAKNRNKVVFL